MIDWMLKQILFPDYYVLIFYVVLVLAVLLLYFESQFFEKNKLYKIFSILFVPFLVLLIGYRSIGENGFLDTQLYIDFFTIAKTHSDLRAHNDLGFGSWVVFTSFFLNVRGFFVASAMLGMGLLYLTSKNFFKENWFLFFLCFCSSLYFLDFQVFAIRQGLATLFFLYGISHRKWWAQLLFIAIAVTFHKSLILPAVAFIMTLFFNKTPYYVAAWFLSIVVSYFSGHFWESFFAKFLQDDIRVNYLVIFDENSKELVRTGFRLDIVFYSLIFVLIGCYYYFRRNIRDAVYSRILNLFLVSNLVMILIIRANTIYRFLYLSVFLIPLIIIYPIIYRKKFTDSTYKMSMVVISIYLSLFFVYKIYKQYQL